MSLKLVALLTCCLVIPSSADWEGFVFDKMQAFGNYIRDHNFDPTPSLEQRHHFSDSNGDVAVDTELWHLTLWNFWTHIKPAYTRINWLAGEFDIGLETDVPFVVRGMHNTNWSVAGTSIQTNGTWVSHQEIMYFKDCSIQFRVLPSGYLNVTEVLKCWSSWRSFNISFEGISDNEAADGYQVLLQPLLEGAARTYYGQYAERPITQIFGQFWKEILSNTTIAELIGYTGTREPGTPTTPYWTLINNPDPLDAGTV